MRNPRIMKFLTIATMTSFMVMFQNCSDMQSSVLSQGQDNKMNGVNGPTLGPVAADGSEEISIDTEAGTLAPPPVQAPPLVQTLPPVVKNDPDVSSSETHKDPEKEDYTKKEHDVDHPEAIEQKEYELACKQIARFRIKNILVDADRVENEHGPVMVKSDRIELIENHASQLVVIGNTSTAMVNRIIEVRGTTVICNAIVNHIEHVRGKLVLVDSIVNNPLIDHQGSLILIRSKIKN